MESKNLITLDFSSSPKLAEIFAAKTPGDKCKFEVTLKIKEITDSGVTGVIEKVESDYHENEKEAEPTPEEPMAIEVRPKSKHALELEETY